MFSKTVREHWQTYLPQEWAAMADPEAFVKAKALEIQVATLVAAEALEQTRPQPEEYEAAIGWFRQIKADATAMVLRDLLPEPEPETETVAELTPEMVELQALRDAVYDL
ncbi:hypothetical protein ACFV4Q_00455 [Streptomyces nojiriensis]|uniref:hypothetical protein n=1 Tax=Streptomyces nojiriensis TaxID=66374 RepID=UPI003666E592